MNLRYCKIPSSLLIFTITAFFSCSRDHCIVKGPSGNIYNSNIGESKKEGVFQYRALMSKDKIYLDTNLYFKVDTAWVEKAWGYECIDNRRTKEIYDWKYLTVKTVYIGNKKEGYYYFLGKHPIGTFKHYYLDDSASLMYYVYKDTVDSNPELKYRIHKDSMATVTAAQIEYVNKMRRQRIIDSVVFIKDLSER